VPGSAFVAALLAGVAAAVAAFVAPALAAPGDIANRAGSGAVFPDTGAFSGDGGPATRAVLRHPSDVDALPGGGFVVTDSEHERIRVVAPDGTITTLAGDGRKCEQATAACGDGGPATAASLNVPHGVAALPGGGVLVADTFTNRVRAVAPDGTIRTVAGDGRACVPATGCGDGARGTTPGGRSAGRTATGARDLASSAALPAGASPSAPARRAPAAVLAVLRRPLAIAARRRLRVPVTFPAGAPRACRGTLAARTAPRVRCAGRTRALPLGAARFALAPGATRGVRLPVPAATARCLRGRRVPALLTAPGLRLRVSVRALSPQRASRRRR